MQAANPLSSLPSPIRSRKFAPIPGFRIPPKPKPPPIEELTIRELRDLYDRNAKILATPAPSTSTYVPRIMAEQAKIEAQLVELEGMQDIQDGLELTHIGEDQPMPVDRAPEPPRPIEAKLRALEKFGSSFRQQNGDRVPGLSFEEAVELEQQAYAADLERKQRLLERRQKQGFVTVKGRTLTREEQEARIWAFMNYEPSESDLEDDDDSEDEDPSTWVKDIVEPDAEDLSDIIRVDTSRIYYNTFDEPRDCV
ncbi:hypothetical protein F5148DRAFT_1156780 [Russula earlei]|uniref:Uncharacterized protein n=1 Tax=Russula earlei TaxID=71964 RepID=A0ACC0UNM5_9AGAM|nr:hypothetical protein F5148DRAFT_1156780 [Russula earlei]